MRTLVHRQAIADDPQPRLGHPVGEVDVFVPSSAATSATQRWADASAVANGLPVVRSSELTSRLWKGARKDLGEAFLDASHQRRRFADSIGVEIHADVAHAVIGHQRRVESRPMVGPNG